MLRTIFFFFFNDTATTEIYTLSLHDALPISRRAGNACLLPHCREFHDLGVGPPACSLGHPAERHRAGNPDRKSTRLNSSHLVISYAVFCLKKKIAQMVTSQSCLSTR